MSESATHVRRRNYQACLECQKHKVKCCLGDSEHPQPPCVRCRRARLSCIFGPARRLKLRRAPNLTGAAASFPLPPSAAHEDASQNEEDSEHEEGPTATVETRSAANFSGRSPAASESLGLADHTQQIQPNDSPRATEHSSYTLSSSWTQFNLCRDGYLTSLEAHHLLNYFFRWMHPLYPLVHHRYSYNVASWGQLITEDSLLCTTILVITSRYTWYQIGPCSSKAMEAHGALYRYLQPQIQRCIWASDPERHGEAKSLSLIESIMLMVEWHPRCLDLVATPKDITGSYALESYGYNSAPSAMEPSSLEAGVRHAWDSFKPLNTTSWRLLCIAVNLADELSIHQVITMAYENNHGGDVDVARRAHIREFLVCLVWERCYRLGRRCLISLPSDTGKPPQDVVGGHHPLSELLESRAELYRLTRLIENTLYPSARYTEGILASGDYDSPIIDFSGLLTAWKTRFDRVKESSPPFRKHLEMMWHHTRVFLYSISLKAFVTRSKASSTNIRVPAEAVGNNASMTNSPSDIAQTNQVCRDRNMVGEMISDSEQIIRLALELHRDGLLRHVPLNILYHIASASLVLLRVQRLPLSTRINPMDLLIQLVQALEDSSVDDAYAGSRYASLLRKMIQRVDDDRTQCLSRARCPAQAAAESGDGTMETFESDLHTLLPADGIGNPANPSAQIFCRTFGGLWQEQLLSFELDDEWSRWLNL